MSGEAHTLLPFGHAGRPDSSAAPVLFYRFGRALRAARPRREGYATQEVLMSGSPLPLRQFSDLSIDWNLAPEDAVTLYLEWGNNNWHAEHPPVRSKDDVATYFVVDNWRETPTVRLVRRNSEEAVDLVSLPLPPDLERAFLAEYGGLKGVFEPTPAIKRWLQQELYA